MEKIYAEGEHFENINFTEKPLLTGEYENCSFNNCDLSNANLSNFNFIECSFKDCNLSLANLANSIMRDITFTGCKLLGLHFEYCKPMLFAVKFDHCILDLSSFYKLKLKNTHFFHTSMIEVDLTEADLTGAAFDHCDLHKTIFDNSILEKADLRTSFNYSIDPQGNSIRKAKFSMPAVAGLLYKYDIIIE